MFSLNKKRCLSSNFLAFLTVLILLSSCQEDSSISPNQVNEIVDPYFSTPLDCDTVITCTTYGWLNSVEGLPQPTVYSNPQSVSSTSNSLTLTVNSPYETSLALYELPVGRRVTFQVKLEGSPFPNTAFVSGISGGTIFPTSSWVTYTREVENTNGIAAHIIGNLSGSTAKLKMRNIYVKQYTCTDTSLEIICPPNPPHCQWETVPFSASLLQFEAASSSGTHSLTTTSNSFTITAQPDSWATYVLDMEEGYIYNMTFRATYDQLYQMAAGESGFYPNKVEHFSASRPESPSGYDQQGNPEYQYGTEYGDWIKACHTNDNSCNDWTIWQDSHTFSYDLTEKTHFSTAAQASSVDPTKTSNIRIFNIILKRKCIE